MSGVLSLVTRAVISVGWLSVITVPGYAVVRPLSHGTRGRVVLVVLVVAGL